MGRTGGEAGDAAWITGRCLPVLSPPAHTGSRGNPHLLDRGWCFGFRHRIVGSRDASVDHPCQRPQPV